MNDYTKGTLRVKKPAEDYRLDDDLIAMELELAVIKVLSVVLIVVIAVTYWWFA